MPSRRNDMSRTAELSRSLEAYMSLPYRMEISWDENYWAVEFPELPHLAADADRWEDLPAAIEEAKRVYFTSMLEDGKPIPEPKPFHEQFSGKFVVRIPTGLHARLVETAEREGVSLNTLAVSALAQAVGTGGTRPLPPARAAGSSVARPRPSAR
ncbi:MAG: toxin-antitoxin system HicB family antitoxin [Chloroflexi bacterium]|nr:toxin-antitoxin system HicB family antitoxin [Chloroflexota bacterium]